MNTKAKSNLNGNGHEGPMFMLHSVYLKDSSFESPKAPYIFNKKWEPRLGFDLDTSFNQIEPDVYEVVVSVTVTVQLGEEQAPDAEVAFLIEVKQAGVFTLKGFDEAELKRVCSTICPNVLFPYAREVVSNLVTKGGFPQLVLPPMNFDAIYAQHMEKQAAEATG